LLYNLRGCHFHVVIFELLLIN